MLKAAVLNATLTSWTGNHLAANLFELINTLGEGNDLSGADKGEVKWVEEEHHILA